MVRTRINKYDENKGEATQGEGEKWILDCVRKTKNKE